MPSKPPRRQRIQDWCEDAVQAIDRIYSYIDGMAVDEFETDQKTISAVERELLIVAEVLARMPEFCEVYEDGHRVRGLGNRLRHDYERVDHRLVWDAVSTQPIGELRSALVEFRPK